MIQAKTTGFVVGLTLLLIGVIEVYAHYNLFQYAESGLLTSNVEALSFYEGDDGEIRVVNINDRIWEEKEYFQLGERQLCRTTTYHKVDCIDKGLIPCTPSYEVLDIQEEIIH